MTKEEELAKYMTLIEQYKEQMNSIEMQSQYLQAAITDYSKAKITLEQLINADPGSEILLPIGGSTYLDATAKNTSKVLFDIGGGIVTEKTSEDAIKKIDQRIEDLQKTQEKLLTMMQNLQNEATEVSAKAQKLYEEQQK
jgi:prefoldin alpha subunit